MSVAVDTVNSFFGHPAGHGPFPYDDALRPRTRRDSSMSATGRRASSSSATHTTQHQSTRPQTSQDLQQSEFQPAEPSLAARSPGPESQRTTSRGRDTPSVTPADTRRPQARKIKVRDLEHIQSFAAADSGAFSEIRSSSRSRSRGAREESPQYEISEMKVEHIIEMVAGLLTKITTTNDQQHEHLHRQPPQPETASHMDPQTNSVLAFHGKNVPSITILSYLSRINKYCPTSYEVFLSLLVYFDRMTEKVNAGPMHDLRQANDAALEYNRSASASTEALSLDRMEGVTATTPQGIQTVTPPQSGSLEKAPEDSRPGTPHSRSFQTESPTAPAEQNAIDPYSLSHFFVVDSFNIHRLVIAGVTCASKFFSDIFYTNSRYAKVGGLPLPELNHLELQFLLLNDFRLSVPVEEIEAYGTMLVEFYAREIVAQDDLNRAQAMQTRSLSESSSDSTNTVTAVA